MLPTPAPRPPLHKRKWFWPVVVAVSLIVLTLFIAEASQPDCVDSVYGYTVCEGQPGYEAAKAGNDAGNAFAGIVVILGLFILAPIVIAAGVFVLIALVSGKTAFDWTRNRQPQPMVQAPI